jgi:hypothetical protein
MTWYLLQSVVAATAGQERKHDASIEMNGRQLSKSEQTDGDDRAQTFHSTPTSTQTYSPHGQHVPHGDEGTASHIDGDIAKEDFASYVEFAPDILID